MERSPNPTNLADAFVGLARRWPERTALISPGLTLTYPALAARAAQTARQLRLRGVTPGANIGIGIRNNAETLIEMIALWMLGATAVPLDFRATGADLSLAKTYSVGCSQPRAPRPLHQRFDALQHGAFVLRDFENLREILRSRDSPAPSRGFMIGQHANEIHRKKWRARRDFELLTPRFVVWSGRLICSDSLQTGHKSAP